MKLRIGLVITALTLVGLMIACNPNPATNSAGSAPNTTAPSSIAGPLPDNGYKAEVTIAEPPTKLRTGQKETINIKIKNVSDVTWFQRGGEISNQTDNKLYLAAGNQWLDKDGKQTSEEEGHNGIPKNLKPGEETQMTLLITAPKTPGEYFMRLDMVQEGVTWFGDKGSTTTKVPVTVVK